MTLEGTGRVVLVHRNRLSTSAQAVTDREGYFRFRGLAPNGSRVYATVASADRGASREVELTPGLVAHNLKVVAPPLATIGGTVLSRGGVPASGALVRLYTVDPTSGRATGPPIGHIFCTAAGEFGWPRLAPGSYRVDVLFELVPVVHSEAFRVSEGGSKALRLQPR